MEDEADEAGKKVSKARELKLRKRNTRMAIEAQRMVLESADAFGPSSQAPKRKSKVIDDMYVTYSLSLIYHMLSWLARINKKQKMDTPMAGLVADWIKLIPPAPPHKHAAAPSTQAHLASDNQSQASSKPHNFRPSLDSDDFPAPVPTQPSNSRFTRKEGHAVVRLDVDFSDEALSEYEDNEDGDEESQRSITLFEARYGGFEDEDDSKEANAQ